MLEHGISSPRPQGSVGAGESRSLVASAGLPRTAGCSNTSGIPELGAHASRYEWSVLCFPARARSPVHGYMFQSFAGFVDAFVHNFFEIDRSATLCTFSATTS